MVERPSFGGVHVALATPVEESGELDHAGLHRLVDRVVAAGVSVVCSTGSTGEGPRLSRQQRCEVLTAVRDRAGSDVRVVPAPAAQTAAEVLEELREFATLGAAAALVPEPSYFPMSPAEVRRYYQTVADEAPLPLLIYNIPPMTGVSVAPAVVGELARHPNVSGIKDSSRDFEYFQEIVAATADSADFSVLTGSDSMLLASLVVGGHGTIAASANVVPELSTGVYASVQAEDWAEARRFQRRLHDVVRACRSGSPPGGWKAALEHVGVCSRRLVAPGAGLDDTEFEGLGKRLAELGVPSA